jgi:hypothetical protein
MPKIDLRQIEQPTWTPELVRDRMIEAVCWARYNGGPTGPAPLRSMMPKFEPTLAEHLAEGWGLPEKAEGVDEASTVLRIPLSPKRVDEMIWVLDWCRLYLVRDRPGDAVILNLWLRCRVYRGNFDAALERRGFALTRRHAYRMRDRALSHISQRLDGEGFRP